jgi:hypothetical protein
MVKVVRQLVYRVIAAGSVWLLTISLGELNSATAQDASVVGAAGNACGLDKIKGFERRPVATHQVTANFIAKPDAGADVSEIKKYVSYLHVLAKFSSRQLYKSSSGRCAFGANTDTSPNLHFELFSIGQNVHDECSLRRCARSLSDLIQTAIMDQGGFSQTIDALAAAIRRSDSVDFRYPWLAARNALQEVYRHIYPPGTRERILVDISSDDFLHMRFDDFSAWFKTQQAALRDANDRPGPLAATSPPPTAQTEDLPGGTTRDVDVEELSIDSHGWGHQSIILMDHAYEREGIAGIENATLRALCHPSGKDTELDVEPWREMVGRLSCHREVLGRDRWLSLYSKKEPTATGAEMVRYAQAIAQVLRSDQRPYPGLRVIVAKFSRQK